MKLGKARCSSEQIGPISPPLCRPRGVLLKAKQHAREKKKGRKETYPCVYTDRPRDTETDRDKTDEFLFVDVPEKTTTFTN